MGTNFYIFMNKCECCGRFDKVHLGKASVGLKFTFRKTDEIVEGKHVYHARNKHEMLELTSFRTIFDEYGRKYNFGMFWDIVEKSQNNKDANGELIDGYVFFEGEFC